MMESGSVQPGFFPILHIVLICCVYNMNTDRRKPQNLSGTNRLPFKEAWSS